MCMKTRVLYENQIVQYLQNYKRHEFDQGHSAKLIQMENTNTTRLLFKGNWILTYFDITLAISREKLQNYTF